MRNTELIDFLQSKLASSVTNISTPREKRVFAETTVDNLVAVATSLKEWGLYYLGTITGLDSGDKFEIIYHFYDDYGLIFNLKVFTPRDNPKVPTVTTVFPGVFLYERELMDLLGIDVEGTPPNRRYPLPDDWPAGQYPLRKDWKGLPSVEEVSK
ncbi:MAG TPA: proton-conducting membrane transporter [Firmicutes bacterium]|jgi:membrane-bound hydrogenase subunit beta|nr:proton-conducting membrane transporter [Bacillota bacterium]